MRRLQASKIDPAKVAAPVDAFARFGEESGDADQLAALDGEAFAELDASLDAFASLPESTSAPMPPAQNTESTDAPVVEEAVPAMAAEPQPWSELDVEPAPVPAVPIASDSVALDSVASSAAPEPVPAPPTPESEAPAEQTAIAATPGPAESETNLAASTAPSSNGSSRKTVMIVDDSPTIRKILGLTLERAGYKVVAEPDGESAIERLIHVVPDLILLDIAMPKIDGYDVCKRIKQDPRTKHVPVVMLSGKGALFDKVKGHMAGATEYLTKPFETPAVLAVVTNYCEQPVAEVVNG